MVARSADASAAPGAAITPTPAATRRRAPIPPSTTLSGLEKPTLDQREYRRVVLPNGLEAMLISDVHADRAGAALDVNIGYFQDPEDYPGLAHFLEHLLFLGTAKFPKENEYSAYLQDHSGWSNAYTDSENTNYHFEVDAPAFEGAIDRFAQFFIAPLFDPSCTDRELKAVDSEHKKNLQADAWRLQQVDAELAAPEHPYHKFGTGSSETLKDRVSEDGQTVIPTRDRVMAFYKEYYSANLMRVALVGPQSLDTLESWLTTYFSPIPNQNLALPSYVGQPFDARHVGRVVYAVPIRDEPYLSLTWQFDDQRPHYGKAGLQYLGDLLGQETKGSLLSLLKAKSYAHELFAGADDSGRGFAFFNIQIGLTRRGAHHWVAVLAHAFQWIRMIQSHGVLRWYWDECRDLADMSFRFSEAGAPGDYAVTVSNHMHLYAPNHVLSGSTLFREYDADHLGALLQHLTFDQCRVLLVSQSLCDEAPPPPPPVVAPKEPAAGRSSSASSIDGAKKKDDESEEEVEALDELDAMDYSDSESESDDENAPEPDGVDHFPALAAPADPKGWKILPWGYACQYQAQPCPPELRASIAMLKAHPDLHLPPPNPFIPNVPDEQGVPNPKLPQPTRPALVKETPLYRLWHLTDQQFAVPKSVIHLYVRNPRVYGSVHMAAAHLMWIAALRDALNETTYQASLASVEVHIDASLEGTVIVLSGYTEILPTVFARIWAAMWAKPFTAPSHRWDAVKRHLIRNLRNTRYKSAQSFAVYSCLLAIQSALYMWNDKAAALEGITQSDVERLVHTSREQLSMEVLITGNMTAAASEALIADALAQIRGPDTARPAPLPTSIRYALSRNHLIPTQRDWIYPLVLPNEDDVNSAIEWYVQLSPGLTAKDRLAVQLFDQITNEACFDVLRTQQQLGYLVHSGVRRHVGLIGFYVLIQSDRAPTDLHDRIEAFIAGTPARIRALSPQAFRKHRESLAATLTTRERNLAEEHARVWSAIYMGTWNFSVSHDDAAALLETSSSSSPSAEAAEATDVAAAADWTLWSQEDLATWVEHNIVAGGHQRRGFAAHIWSRRVVPGLPKAESDDESESGSDSEDDDGASGSEGSVSESESKSEDNAPSLSSVHAAFEGPDAVMDESSAAARRRAQARDSVVAATQAWLDAKPEVGARSTVIRSYAELLTAKASWQLSVGSQHTGPGPNVVPE